MINKIMSKLKKAYVLNHAKKSEIPEFDPSDIVRKHLIFKGKVQNVGFRVEMYGVANRIGVSGWVQNREDLSVEAELQGERNRVLFLIDYMTHLNRADVSGVESSDLDIKDNETEFTLNM